MFSSVIIPMRMFSAAHITAFVCVFYTIIIIYYFSVNTSKRSTRRVLRSYWVKPCIFFRYFSFLVDVFPYRSCRKHDESVVYYAKSNVKILLFMLHNNRSLMKSNRGKNSSFELNNLSHGDELRVPLASRSFSLVFRYTQRRIFKHEISRVICFSGHSEVVSAVSVFKQSVKSSSTAPTSKSHCIVDRCYLFFFYL